MEAIGIKIFCFIFGVDHQAHEMRATMIRRRKIDNKTVARSQMMIVFFNNVAEKIAGFNTFETPSVFFSTPFTLS